MFFFFGPFKESQDYWPTLSTKNRAIYKSKKSSSLHKELYINEIEWVRKIYGAFRSGSESSLIAYRNKYIFSWRKSNFLFVTFITLQKICLTHKSIITTFRIWNNKINLKNCIFWIQKKLFCAHKYLMGNPCLLFSLEVAQSEIMILVTTFVILK